MTDHPSSLNGV